MSKLGCEFAVEVKGVVRCGVVDYMTRREIKVSDIDHSLQGMNLCLALGAFGTVCGLDSSEQRSRCVGSCINPRNLPLLGEAIRDSVVLIHPENKVLLARLVADRYFEQIVG